ncbi:MAG: glycosyltransferase, partial [Candidatus Heimdallarchaeota archaeon]
MPSFKSLIFLIFGGRYGSKYLRDLAIGQYILVKKETYDGFGGHEVIKDKIAEDIHLASKISSIGSFKSFNGNKIY